jgi:hypothetical protein
MPRLRFVPKHTASAYLGRATQYERQLSLALEERNWESVSLPAVHLAIASTDSVTAAVLGKVWSGENHLGATNLLREAGLEGVATIIRQFASILSEKTRVEYGTELASREATAEMGKRAQRIFEWTVQILVKRAED